MLLRLIIVTICAVAANPALSQNQIYTSTVEHKKFLDTSGAKAGDYFFMAGRTETYQSLIYVINPEKKIFFPQLIPGTELTIVGSQDNIDEVILYLTTTDHIAAISFSKVDNKFKKFRILTERTKKFFSFAQTDSSFYLLTLERKRQQIILHELKKESMNLVVELPVRFEAVFQNLLRSFSYVPQSKEVSFSQSVGMRKVYGVNNRIQIILDTWIGDDKNQILIMELNPKTKTLADRWLSLPFDLDTHHNSLIVQDRFFVVGVNKNFLSIVVYDFPECNKLKEHRVPINEKIYFQASDLLINGEASSLIGSSTGLIIKELRRGSPGIAVGVSNRPDYYRIMVGREREILASGGFVGGVPNPQIIAPGGGTIYVPPSQQFFTVDKTKIEQATFYAFLQKSDLEVPVGYSEGPGPFDRIAHRLELLEKDKVKLGGQCVINTIDGPYLIFLDSKSKALFLEKF